VTRLEMAELTACMVKCPGKHRCGSVQSGAFLEDGAGGLALLESHVLADLNPRQLLSILDHGGV
jgi:hypothetical protein